MKKTEALMTVDLSGKFEVFLENGSKYKAYLPGTLDDNRIGGSDSNTEKCRPDIETEDILKGNVIATRFTRKYVYAGKTSYKRNLNLSEDDLFDIAEGKKRAFIYIERSRKVELFVNDDSASQFIKGTLSTPYVFEVTELLKKENTFVFIVDNTYQDWPAPSIMFSNQADSGSQTNWNGILGEMKFVMTPGSVITDVRVYPGHGWVDVKVDIDSTVSRLETIKLSSFALSESYEEALHINDGKNTFEFMHLPLSSDALKWDEYEGNLYKMEVCGSELLPFTCDFGIRTFSDDNLSYFTLNDRRIFLRGETNCAVFPDTGYIPMTKDKWLYLLSTYKAYGVNFVRFKSYCPPEAAFEAADTLGILLQVELSLWNPVSCFELKEETAYYTLEALSILRWYSNHPSFVMLSLGNESVCDDRGIENCHILLDKCKKFDSTRLYAFSSNGFYGERGADARSDFYTSSGYKNELIRGCTQNFGGFINNKYPDSKSNYDRVLEKINNEYARPVYSFEAGQYQILPSLEEISEFRGNLSCENFKYIEKLAKEKGMDKDWNLRVEASGQLSALCCREEIEAALRTKNMGGICLMGLQDYGSQGNVCTGMINCHGRTKPYAFADPAKFKMQFNSVVPLLKLEKYVYTDQDTLQFIATLANYGKKDICSKPCVSIQKDGCIIFSKTFDKVFAVQGELTDLCEGYFEMWQLKEKGKYTIQISIDEYVNQYDIYLYRDYSKRYEAGCVYDGVYITDTFSVAQQLISNGKKVFLSPPATKETIPYSVKTTFSSNFWSNTVYKNQSGYMGILTDSHHPLFKDFATEFYSSWQWWALTNNAVAMILPKDCEVIVKAIDSPLSLRNLCFIYKKQNLIVSSLGLLEKQDYPESRALINSILNYLKTSS